MSAASAAVRGLILGVVLSAALLTPAAQADEPLTIPQIGVLVPPMANSPYEAGLPDGLRELGYIDGKNIVIEWRRSAGADDELRSFAADLARSKAQLIVAFGTPAARAAVAATTLPVVFLVGDPVATGLVASLAKPGGNATGVSVLTTELTAKRLEYLHMLVPQARRLVLMMNSSNPNQLRTRDAARIAARTLGVQLAILDVRGAGELDAALRALPRSAPDGVLVSADIVFYVNKSKVVRAVHKARLPAMFPYRDYLDDGGLVSYGPNLREVVRSMAAYVDKILKGAKPADLPVEEVSKYELVINLRVAREIGIAVPRDLLLRADEVIR